jgi:hypothetical protein
LQRNEVDLGIEDLAERRVDGELAKAGGLNDRGGQQ